MVSASCRRGSMSKFDIERQANGTGGMDDGLEDVGERREVDRGARSGVDRVEWQISTILVMGSRDHLPRRTAWTSPTPASPLTSTLADPDAYAYDPRLPAAENILCAYANENPGSSYRSP